MNPTHTALVAAFYDLVDLAHEESDGHFTVCKFTTNWRVGLGTPNSREDIDELYVGETFQEAVEHLKESFR